MGTKVQGAGFADLLATVDLFFIFNKCLHIFADAFYSVQRVLPQFVSPYAVACIGYRLVR